MRSIDSVRRAERPAAAPSSTSTGGAVLASSAGNNAVVAGVGPPGFDLGGRTHPERGVAAARVVELERYQLLIVDEVGYLPLERQAANLLFALVSRRYERGSIVITSNRGFEAWGEILGDAMVAAALIDRPVHHATMVTLKGKSYRLRERGTQPA